MLKVKLPSSSKIYPLIDAAFELTNIMCAEGERRSVRNTERKHPRSATTKENDSVTDKESKDLEIRNRFAEIHGILLLVNKPEN